MHSQMGKSARNSGGYYLTNFKPEEEKRYLTAILFSGKKLEVQHNPIPTGFGHCPTYKASNVPGYYCLFNPAGFEDLSDFWRIFDCLKDDEDTA